MPTIQPRIIRDYGAFAGLYIGAAGVAYACQLAFGFTLPYLFWGCYLILLETGLVWVSAVRAEASKAPAHLLVCAALLAYLAGDAYWVSSLGLTGVRPVPVSVYDLSRFVFNVLLLTSFAVQLRQYASRERLLVLADALLIAASLVLILWELGYSSVWGNLSISPNHRQVATGMAAVNVLTLTLALIMGLASLRQGRSTAGGLVVAAGAAFLMVGDLYADLMLVNQTYYEGSAPDVASVAGLLLVGLGLARSIQAAPKPEPRHYWTVHFVRRVPSLLSFTVLLITLGSDFITASAVSPSALGFSLAIIALIGVRHSVCAISDHHARNQELEEIRHALEFDVLRKTAQLREMLDLSGSVNETLEIPQILCRSLDHARKVVRCTNGLARFFVSDNLSETLEQAVWEEGTDVAVPPNYDVRSTPEFQTAKPSAKTFGRQGAFYVISVDIAVGDRQVGWIALGRPDLPFDSMDVELLRGVGQIAAPALANANAYRLAKDAGERDPTTNLLNHRAIHEKLVQDLERARKNRQPLSLIMVDVDNFQRFNATYGHTCGDDLLKLVARAVSDVAPDGALVGRFGADEFVVGLPNFSADGALAVASDLALALEFKSIQPSGDCPPIPVAVTCGIATYPEDCDTYEELLMTAEQNLEQARLIGHEVAMTSEIHRMGRLLRTDSSFEVLDMLVTAVDNKDSYTRKHSEQVAEFATWICEAINLDLETTRLVQQAALLHDVGKIGVPAEILGKPGRLSDEEVAAVNKHSVLGANLVAAFKDMEAILPGVKHHHERWDGLGYPDGLAGNEIPLIARILCIADTFSAMVTDRAYRKALAWNVALEEIKSHIGTQFDPELAEVFIRCAKRKLSVVYAKSKRAA